MIILNIMRLVVFVSWFSAAYMLFAQLIGAAANDGILRFKLLTEAAAAKGQSIDLFLPHVRILNAVVISVRYTNQGTMLFLTALALQIPSQLFQGLVCIRFQPGTWAVVDGSPVHIPLFSSHNSSPVRYVFPGYQSPVHVFYGRMF